MRRPFRVLAPLLLTIPIGLALALSPDPTLLVSSDSPIRPAQAGVPLSAFVNWETPPVHPIELTPDGQMLLVVNQPAARLELFSLASGWPINVGSIPVGLDPVSVRARSNTEAWVVNNIAGKLAPRVSQTLHTVALAYPAWKKDNRPDWKPWITGIFD